LWTRKSEKMWALAGVLLSVVLVLLLDGSNRVRGQDFQYNFITCEDKFDKCELDCSWSLLVSSLEQQLAQ
jgi:hypothetical protein